MNKLWRHFVGEHVIDKRVLGVCEVPQAVLAAADSDHAGAAERPGRFYKE